jgi:phosphate uptake regulator
MKRKHVSHRWIDQIEKIWNEHHELKKEAASLNMKAETLRQQAIDLMKATHPPANPCHVQFGDEAVVQQTDWPA